MCLFFWVDQHFLHEVIGQTDDFLCFEISQIKRSYSAIFDPFLCPLVSLLLENFQTFIDKFLGTFLFRHHSQLISVQYQHNLPQMTDYRSMYENKCKQFEQLTEQYTQLQEQTNLIINDLEDQLKQTRRKNEQMNRDMNQHREKSKCFKSTIEREVELAQKERNEFKKKFIEFEKKVIELEIVNQSLESELRATKARLNEYESQTERTMEELAFAQIELEQTNESNKETVARLRGQLKQAEEELFALQKLRQKAQTAKQQVVGASELGNVQTGGKQLFRETMKGIRDYLDELDNRKSEARKMLFKICSQ